MPAVSVIVPVFDMERYLRQCVQSVLAQTFHDWELILVDDGSTDFSGRLCDRFAAADPRVKVFHTGNSGPASARNLGVGKASGSRLLFLDADDLLHPSAFETLSAVAESSGAAVVCGSIRRVEECFTLSARESPVTPDISSAAGFMITDSVTAVEGLLYQRGLDTSVYGKIFSRSLFEEEGFTEGIIYEDLDLLYRLLFRAGAVAEVSATVYYHRRNPDSLLGRFTPVRADVLAVTRRIEEYMERLHPGLLGAARARRLAACFNIFCLAGLDGNPESEVLCRRCWAEIRALRRKALIDPKLRLKDRAGIIISYVGGQKLVKILSRFVY